MKPTSPLPSTARPGRPRDASRDTAITSATARLVAENGFDAVTIEAVAAEAGVGKTTIYRRWTGKTELVVDAVRARSAAAPPPPDTGSLRGDLLAVLRADVELLQTDSGLVAGVLFALRSRPELAAAVDSIGAAELESRFLVLLDRARVRGELDQAADTVLVAEVVKATLLNRTVHRPAPVDDAFLARFVDHLLLPALTPRSTR